MANKTRRWVFESDQVVILDDFLEPSAFQRVLEYCGRDDYRAVHVNGWRKAWRPSDGFPLQGTAVCAGSVDAIKDVPQRSRFPIGADLDLLIEQLLSVRNEVEPIIGTQGKDWSILTASPWIYPAGTGLSLHEDGHRYSGAFTYFAHREWNVHWGGYLLVLDPNTAKPDPSTDAAAARRHLAWLDDSGENHRVWDPGLARCIFPKPNRLVFISPTAEHLVSRVDPNAGNRTRISIAGFFHRNVPARSV
jgi:2OG-Fe(II) oxygenase superfamily